jgi:hypothetical protein
MEVVGIMDIKVQERGGVKGKRRAAIISFFMVFEKF